MPSKLCLAYLFCSACWIFTAGLQAIYRNWPLFAANLTALAGNLSLAWREWKINNKK